AVDRLELSIVQVDATHIRRDMTADEAVFSDAAQKFLCRSLRILHGQESPGPELQITASDRRSDGVVELPCRRHPKGCIEMIIGEGRGERQDRPFDAFLPHSLDLARQIEEGLIQTEVHSANIKVDAFALFPLDPYLKLGTRLYEVEK